ncbi:MAG: sugar phosphate isomerase/epimerase family protein [Anaerolineae bacterium]
MRYATSTLGCLDWDLEMLVERLPRYGYHAVDLRGLRGTFNLWELPEFSRDVAMTAARLRDAGLAVSCFSASARLVWQDEAERDRALDEIRRLVELCRRFGAGQIRVFGGDLKGLSRAEGLARGRETLARMAEIVQGTGVALAVETHDAWTHSADMLALIADTDPQEVGVCWDVKHPYWTGQETPAFTWRQLGPRIINTHWKDAQRDRATGRERLCLTGEGLLPLADCLDLLLAGGYAGYYTLEWEKKWHPYLPDADIAFPAFVRYMEDLRARIGAGN